MDAGGLRLGGREVSLIRQVVAAAAPGAVDLALGEPRHAVPAAVREALAAAVAGDLRYTPNAGRADLRTAVARRRPHHGTDGASVLVTVGSQEALALAVLGLVGPGDEVVVPELAYPSYEALPELVGARVVRAGLFAIEGALGERTRLVIVGSPANPTGQVVPEARFRRLAELAGERGFHLLSDEVYEEIYLGRSAPRYPAGERVLHVGGLSKSMAATGLRLGWLVAAPSLVARLVPLHQHLVTCAPAPSQAAALAALALRKADLEAVRKVYRARWRRLRRRLEAIDGLTWREPEGTWYAWVDVRSRWPGSTRELALDLARAGEVVVVPGEAFGPTGRGHLRLSFAAPDAEIDEGVGRLAAALDRGPAPG